jgi:signal transduction histidine kinase
MTNGNPSRSSDEVQAELDKQLFHLKTLYDVSHELLGLTDMGMMLRNFLLMTMGTFGTAQGFIMVKNAHRGEISHFESFGIEPEQRSLIQGFCRDAFSNKPFSPFAMGDDASAFPALLAFDIDDGASGVTGLGPKLVGDGYSRDDNELLGTLINNLAVSLKNARYSEALRKALDEIKVLNSAKDKAINHLTHELLTPISLIKGSLSLLSKKLPPIPEYDWKATLARAQRSVDRLHEIQNEVDDIMKGHDHKIRNLLTNMLNQCAAEIEVLFAEQLGEGAVVSKVRQRIDEIFSATEHHPQEINLSQFVTEKLEEIRRLSSHRNIELKPLIESASLIWIPPEPLEKVVKGIVKNAIENTPDEGKIEICVRSRGSAAELRIRDWGVGILPEQQRHIFEGFYHTQDTMLYSSGKPFDFNAGGRGADLLRMKIFSERFNFTLSMISSRCRFIPQPMDVCPGRISDCTFCKTVEDCYDSGGTTFEVLFPEKPM